MKRLTVLLLVSILLLTGCAGPISITGSWKTLSAEEMGLSVSGGFVDTVTTLTFTDQGIGAWEIEIVSSREILRREFTYTLEGTELTILFPDNTMQKFDVARNQDTLILTGQENFSLKRVNK